MAQRIAVTTLNASTIDILNTIRANASYQYQQDVPVVTSANDIPVVGERIMGYPALANEFVNALLNRIALVKVKSATFNNAYANLKKGYLEFGETVEEVFVELAKAREFSAEKAEGRELKRTVGDVRAAFHAINWKVQYPVTIQPEELRQAFMSMDGVQDLIARKVDACNRGAEYDEYLLFKYLIIKAVTSGKMYPVAVDTSDFKNSAIAFRGISNALEFINTKYNESGVHTNTYKDNQYIFMDANYNAQYDVNVLASAFNMDKAEFQGRLKLIDDFTTFDNERFSEIIAGSDMIEEVTTAELNLMKDVIGVLVDEEWFQVYDNLTQFSEKYVASGLYWNYFLNVWKTVSTSPFSNAVVFVKNTASVTAPDTFTAEVVSKGVADEGTVINLEIKPNPDGATLANTAFEFVQGEVATQNLVAVHKYGSIIFGDVANHSTVTLDVKIGGVTYQSATAKSGGSGYSAATLSASAKPGDTVILAKTSLIS